MKYPRSGSPTSRRTTNTTDYKKPSIITRVRKNVGPEEGAAAPFFMHRRILRNERNSLVVLCCLLSQLWTPLRAETMDPDRVGLPRTRSGQAGEDQKKRSRFVQDYWSLEPGVAITSLSLGLRGTGFRQSNHATVLNAPDTLQPVWSLDILSPDVALTDQIGLQLWFHGRAFDMRYQKYQDATFDLGGEGSDAQVVANLGTRVRGQYYAVLPSIYFSTSGNPGRFRFGLGIGPSMVNLKGNPFVDNDWNRAILLSASGRADLVAGLQSASLIQTGLDWSTGDRLYNSLMLTLHEPGGLERMGAYILSRGKLKTDITTLYLITYLSSDQLPGRLQFNPLEAIGAVGASRLNLDFREKHAPTYFLYGQYAWEWVTLRVSFGGPVFVRNGFRYELVGVMASLAFPIHG